MPKGLMYTLMILVILAMIPPALIARTRAVNSDKRRIHIIQDMDRQGRFQAQEPSRIFLDGRAMRPPVENTIAREDALREDGHLYRGVVAASDGSPAWATTYPAQLPITEDFIRHGQERFEIYCRPCHGAAGYGDGIVSIRAMQLLVSGQGGTTWVQPKNIHEPLIREQPPGQLFNTITHGIRNMAGYESQIPVADRWAIVAYVKAMQMSQNASIQDVNEELRDNLPVVPLPPGAVEQATQPAASTQ